MSNSAPQVVRVLAAQEVRWDAAWSTFENRAAQTRVKVEIAGERGAEEVAGEMSCDRAM